MDVSWQRCLQVSHPCQEVQKYTVKPTIVNWVFMSNMTLGRRCLQNYRARTSRTCPLLTASRTGTK
ncbi:hypothetical protein NC651_014022 [Populus alba x Populus x berolinensis]|nr:hypothetical protein NC651_014022 [Populus alba x Populus x berolinensis]